ncbi:MAG: hypothetical protein AAGD22_05810 [Verrucomicrobiota bacterium]
MSERLIRFFAILALVALAFYAGFKTASQGSKLPGADPAKHSKTRIDTLLPKIITQAAQLDHASFTDVIRGATGHSILPVNQNLETDREIVQALRETLDETLRRMNAQDSPVLGLARINEASRFFEDTLRELLNAHPDFACAVPTNAQGETQRAGYPDLRLVHKKSNRIVYLDPKLFDEKSQNSSLRTFYFEPKTRTNKVLDDAHHLLVGFAHDGNDGAWKFRNWHLVDLSRFKINFKAEFQAGNKDLYRPELVIISSGED